MLNPMPISTEEIAAAQPYLLVVLRWRAFKRSHNVADAKICCCVKTRDLFDSLDELEKQILADLDGGGESP